LALATVADADIAPDLTADLLDSHGDTIGALEHAAMKRTARPGFDEGRPVITFELDATTRKCVDLITALKLIAAERKTRAAASHISYRERKDAASASFCCSNRLTSGSEPRERLRVVDVELAFVHHEVAGMTGHLGVAWIVADLLPIVVLGAGHRDDLEVWQGTPPLLLLGLRRLDDTVLAFVAESR
jgi:hypothetical protein